MSGHRFHFGAGVPRAVNQNIKCLPFQSPLDFEKSNLDRWRFALDGRIRPPSSPDCAKGRYNNAFSAAPERARRHAEKLAALTDEVGGIGQADPQSDPTDADAIEPRLAQHPLRRRHPAIVEQPAKRHGPPC
jgi:hypothetical protein